MWWTADALVYLFISQGNENSRGPNQLNGRRMFGIYNYVVGITHANLVALRERGLDERTRDLLHVFTARAMLALQALY